MALVCKLYPVERAHNLPFNTTTDYLKHIQLFHAHQLDFHITCGMSECARTFKKFHTFRKHISDWHSCDPNPTNQQVDSPPEPHASTTIEANGSTDPDGAHDQDHAELRTTMSTLQTSSVLFLMGLKEERKLTQTALQGVVEGATSLTQSHLSVLHSEVCSALQAAGLSPSSVPQIEELFNSEGPAGRFWAWRHRTNSCFLTSQFV
jgi:hypothetical protein